MLSLFNFLHDTLGIDKFTLIPTIQMIMRGILIYFFGIIIARFNKKLLSSRTPFNLILFIILGAALTNALVHANMFIATILTIFVLVSLSNLATVLIFYYPRIDFFMKGPEFVLIKNGQMQLDTMKKNFITEKELFGELRIKLHINDPKLIELATLTDEGTIEFILKK